MDLNRSILSDIVFHMKYAKYLPEKKRRETWEECVQRNMEMHIKKFPQLEDEIRENYKFVFEKKVLPSMRSMQFAGKPIEINPSRIYNCAYLPIDDWRAFQEVMHLLLGGTGVGFSCQNHHIEKLPEILKPRKDRKRRYLIGDSIEGWSDSIKMIMKSYFGGGSTIDFDFSDIRSKGARLITSGGKAPGPQPLKECLVKIEGILDSKKDGEKLKPIEVHDIICHIADAVLAGGIRRAALISLFSADDDEMLACKSGNWWELNPQRGRANNSAVLLRHRITKEFFEDLWKRVELSNAGEPGLYFSNDKDWGTNPCCFTGDMQILTTHGPNSLKNLVYTNNSLLGSDFRKIFINKDGEVVSGKVWSNGQKQTIILHLSNGKLLKCTPDHILMDSDERSISAENTIGRTLRGFEYDVIVTKIEVGEIEEVFDFSLEDETHWGIVQGVVAHNCEIALRPFQFCNLTTINVSDVSSQEDLNSRAIAASYIATLQATYTDFHYLRPIWKRTTEKDALLGVSMTGIASNAISELNLKETAKLVVAENKKLSKILGISQSARITTIKPEGTGSLVLGTSSGIHAYHNNWYIRRLRVNKNEAIYQHLFLHHPELLEDEYFRPKESAVISVPISAPSEATIRTESAMDLLNRVKKFNLEWVKPGHRSGENTHNVSATISLKPEDWNEVGEWVWENRDSFNGLSFLPYDGGSYIQAPFQDITEEEFIQLSKNLHNVDLTQVIEIEDNTTLSDNVACGPGGCELI